MSTPADRAERGAALDARNVEGRSTTELENHSHLSVSRPFADGADALAASGLGSPLPIPFRRKEYPPTGYTGRKGIRPSGPDLEEWRAHRGSDNIAVRLAEDVVGIDVDAYDGKQGAATVSSFEAEYGALPPTYRITSRPDNVSGIGLYRLPEGADETDLADMGPGVEVIRHSFRYVMAGGSVHPEGRTYAYVAPDGARSPTPPHRDDLPTLAPAQVAGLRCKAKPSTGAKAHSQSIEDLEADLERLPGLRLRVGGWLPDLERYRTEDARPLATMRDSGEDADGNTWQSSDRAGLLPDKLLRAARLDLTNEVVNGDADEVYLSALLDEFTQADKVMRDRTSEGHTRRAYIDRFVERNKAKAKEYGPQLPAVYAQWVADEETAERLSTATLMSSTSTTAPQARENEGGKQTNAELVAARALAGYTLGVTPEGEPFAVEHNGTGLAIPLGAKGDGLRGRVAAAIYDESGRVIGAEALSSGLGIVIAKAKASETATPMHLRVAHDPDQIVLDLGQPNSARCVVITPQGWTVEERPPAGTLFRRTGTTRPLPTPQRGGSLDVLRDLLGFAADDSRWLLVRGWLSASLRCNSPRPLLLMLGAAGSGKTSRGHLIVNVLDPRPELGSSFGRNLDDDRTKAFNSFQLGYDNLTSISEQTSDQVCRTVTGDAAEKRRNYTDTDVVVMPYRRTGVMTAINAPALRPDALERIIPIPLSAMPNGARRSEEHLWSTFDDAHPGILGAILDDAVTMLAGLPDVIGRNDGPRMLDYWQSLLAIDPVLAEAYADSAADVLTVAAEDDPLVVTVRAWLRAFPRTEREGEPADEFASLDDFARRQPTGVPTWWPVTHRSMSAALTKATNTLAAVGVTFERGKSNGRRTWRFVLDEEQGR